MMVDIANYVPIQMNDYGVLFQWTQGLSSQDSALDVVFGKHLLQFFIFVTWNKNSSSALMKYLCNDVVNYFGLTDRSQEIEASVFNFFADDTSANILKIVFDEQANILSSFEWFISYKSKFDNVQEITTFYKQINCFMQSINSLLLADLPPGPIQESLMRVLIKFFNFMIALSKYVIR